MPDADFPSSDDEEGDNEALRRHVVVPEKEEEEEVVVVEQDEVEEEQEKQDEARASRARKGGVWKDQKSLSTKKNICAQLYPKTSLLLLLLAPTPAIFLAGLAAHRWESHARFIPRPRGAGSARAPLLGLMALARSSFWDAPSTP